MNKVKWGVIGAGGIADRRTILGMMLAENAESSISGGDKFSTSGGVESPSEAPMFSYRRKSELFHLG